MTRHAQNTIQVRTALLLLGAATSLTLWMARRLPSSKQSGDPDPHFPTPAPAASTAPAPPPTARKALNPPRKLPPKATKAAVKASQPAQQGNAGRVAMYSSMGAELAGAGLNLEAVAGARKSFGGLDEPDWPTVWPRKYPLPFPSVRLVVIPLAPTTTLPRPAADPGPQVTTPIAAAGGAIIRAMMAILQGCQVFPNPRASLHASMFYLSHPSDVRRDPLSGGPAPEGPAPPPAPSRDMLDAEVAAMQRLADSVPRLVLQVERVVFARSGTVLMLFTDATGEPTGAAPGPTPAAVDTMREAMRDAFPGAPTQQPVKLIHATLVRFLGPEEPLSGARVAAIQALCEEWTARLRGTRVLADRMWLVHEREFSTLEGQREEIWLRGAAVEAHEL